MRAVMTIGAALVAGCVAGGGSGGGTTTALAEAGACCWAGDAAPTFSQTVEGQALAKAVGRELDNLHRQFGRYTRGEAPVFVGTATVVQSSFGQSGTTLDGEVLASIVVEGDPAQARLSLFQTAPRKRIALTQDPDAPEATHVTLVSDDMSTYGVTGSCDGCLVALTEAPETLDVGPFTAKGEYGDGSPFEVTVTAHLVRVAPDALTFAQVKELNAPFFSEEERFAFEEQGYVLVQKGEAAWSEPVPPPVAGETGDCHRQVQYRVERTLRASCLGSYGVRAVEATNTSTCCYAGGCGGATCY